MRKYRIRFCCDVCRKWDVLNDPIPYLVSRCNNWFEAMDLVKSLQFDELRRSNIAEQKLPTDRS